MWVSSMMVPPHLTSLQSAFVRPACHGIECLTACTPPTILSRTTSLSPHPIVPVKDILGIHHIFFRRCAKMKISTIVKTKAQGISGHAEILFDGSGHFPHRTMTGIPMKFPDIRTNSNRTKKNILSLGCLFITDYCLIICFHIVVLSEG